MLDQSVSVCRVGSETLDVRRFRVVDVVECECEWLDALEGLLLLFGLLFRLGKYDHKPERRWTSTLLDTGIGVSI